MVQIVAGLLTIAGLGIFTLIMYKRRVGERPDVEITRVKTMDTLAKVIKDEFADALKEDEVIMTDDISYEAISRNRRRIEKANTESVYGIPSARQVIVAMIRDIIEREVPTREEACKIIDFDNLLILDSHTKFEILILKLYKKYGKNLIMYLEKKYHLTDPRIVDNGYSDKPIREWDYKLLDVIFSNEVEPDEGETEILSYSEILDIIAIKQYQSYHGFDVIDTLLLLNIDGINLGTSGSIRYEIDGNYDIPYRTVNSVWVQIDAKWVLFSFLDFYTVPKMKKVINQLVSYGSAAPMTEKKPFKVTDGYDGSRRVAIRPPAGEAWAIMIRKFVLSIHSTPELLDKEGITNWELPAQLIYFLMKAEMTTAFTGPINTGKTTAMKGAVEYIDLRNIRVLEMSFELALREIYNNKNIFTVKPSEYVSSANLQDLLKKMDGWVSMVGEVSEDIVAARMIQFCLVASAFTLFSSHHMDDDALVAGLANSLVASGEYNDHNIAVSIVLDVIHNNIHYGFTDGMEHRVIEYISQIIKENEVQPYPEISTLMEEARAALKDEKVDKVAEILVAQTLLMRENFTRTTDRVRHTSRKIVEFNKQTWTYEAKEWYTPEQTQKFLKRLNPQDKEKFIAFYYKYWRC